MEQQDAQYVGEEPQEVEGDQGEVYGGEEDFLTEEEDGEEEGPTPEQQMLDNARELLGLNEAANGSTPSAEKTESVFAKLMRPLGTVPLYPIKLVQVLIQLGYEPTAPERRYSFVFRQYLYYYPGIYGYASNIVKRDGWRALYRGLGASLCSSMVGITAHTFIHPVVSHAVTNLPLWTVNEATNGDVPDTEPQEIETTRAVLVQATRSFIISIVTSVSVEMVVRPFNVIVIRSIAQHVGKEDFYSSVWSSIRQIYDDEGISGFYAGLTPAILGHLFSCLIYSSMWIFFEMVAINSPYRWIKMMVQGLIAVPLLAYIPRTYSYPFTLMTNMMAVNNSRLQIARQPAYTSWLDCYRDLKSTGSLYRGSVVLFPRFAYKVPPVS